MLLRRDEEDEPPKDVLGRHPEVDELSDEPSQEEEALYGTSPPRTPRQMKRMSGKHHRTQGRATGRSPNKGEPGTNGRWREGGWGGVGWGNGSHAMIHVMCSDIFTRPLFRRPLFAIRNLNGAIVLCYSQRPQRWGNGRHGISHVMCVRPLFSGPLFAMVFVS